MTPTDNTNDPVQRLLERVRSDLAWLDEDDFAETRCMVLRSGFGLDWDGPLASLTVGVDIPRREIVVRVRPSGAQKWYGMAQLLRARGLSVGGELVHFTTWDEADAVLDRYMNDLKLMREHELAGKWSEPEVEAARPGPPRKAALEEVLRRVDEAKGRQP
jgi:hypothetical protein